MENYVHNLSGFFFYHVNLEATLPIVLVCCQDQWIYINRTVSQHQNTQRPAESKRLGETESILNVHILSIHKENARAQTSTFIDIRFPASLRNQRVTASCVELWQLSNYDWGIDYGQYYCMLVKHYIKTENSSSFQGFLSAGRAYRVVVVV